MLATLMASPATPVRGDTNIELVWGLTLFLIVGAVIVLAILTIGRLVRPYLPHPEKALPYECGEPPVGDSWVQFDLRFYIVALFFIVFDVEIALLWPWAVIYKDLGAFGLLAMLFFLAPILVGFAYEWKFGYLDWVRACTAQHPEAAGGGER
jgi:NADH-quinone oxidoreductase subunit A